MKRKTMKNMKVYFIIANMLIAIFAFSYLVSAVVFPWDSSSPLPTSGGCGAGCTAAGAIGSAAAPATTTVIKQASVGNAGVIKSSGGIKEAAASYFGDGLLKNLFIAGGIGILGAFIGSWAGGEKGALWGFVSFFSGATVYQLLNPLMGAWAFLPGIGVGAFIFVLTYRQNYQEQVNFNCLPWQAPTGGKDCEKCNKLPECSEYSCKSLGQACGIVNEGTPQQKCIWKNPYDVNSPVIELKKVSTGYKFIPDKAIRPPATGAVVSQTNGNCIKAFFPLEFTISSDEPSQCKIDYALKNFTEMAYYVGGENIFDYNHTEKLSLPGPDAINKVAPDLKNDGSYTLYVRCQDANGNVNVNPFSVKFCVEKGPDTTPPYIVDVSIPNNSPFQYNRSSVAIEVYVNEPSECKWSRTDQDYSKMENTMACSNNLWEMNSNEVYTCKTTLTGLESKKENVYYFACSDQPTAASGRNTMKENYKYVLQGTQPLNILESGPTETAYGSTDSVPVYLTVETDNGYKNGEAVCYYSMNKKPVKDSEWIQFFETKTNSHKQRQDLAAGDYTYYYKCIDLGGNAAYNQTSFRVEVDKNAPVVARVYKENEQLKIITLEKSDCSYSSNDCNFDIDAGIKMSSMDYINHAAEWKLNQNYFIRCKDKYGNEPNPNTCSMIARAARFS